MSDLAVFTGDIVGSSRLSRAELEGAMEALAGAAEAAAGWTGGEARFARFRGDGWQCLAPSPRLALRAALFLRAVLRREGRERDTRIALGVGPGRTPQGELAAAGGAAFRASGAALDKMPRAARLAPGWAERADPGAAAGPLRGVWALADEVSRRWTPAQAGVMALWLPPGAATQAAIAGRLGVSQQTVADHWRAAGGWAVEAALAGVEEGE